jgi:hypothetical protein
MLRGRKAYATLHGVEMLREAYGWPEVLPRLTVLTLLLGFPVVLPYEEAGFR